MTKRLHVYFEQVPDDLSRSHWNLCGVPYPNMFGLDCVVKSG